MNRFFLTGILILGCVCFTVGKSYACPIVEIETDPQECGQKVLDDEACVGPVSYTHLTLPTKA